MPTATFADSVIPMMVRSMNTARRPTVAGMTGRAGQMPWP